MQIQEVPTDGGQPTPVVQRLRGTIQRIDRYSLDKFYQNQLSYPVDIN